MPPTLTDLARGSCQGSSAPTVVAAAQQPTLPPQNLNIPFKTMEWNGPVAGRLSRFIENWKLITTDPWVLNTVQGHQIEFLQQPGFHRLPPMHYSHQEKLAISEEVTKMQGKGAVVPVHRDLQEECFLSNLFLVPKKDGGMRPVINLKGLNHFVKSEHFKMEGLHLLSTMVKPGDWFTKVDLKDAYFHVPIHQTHQKFLSFRWEGRVFQFVCLPFGLASAPRTFTKVMKPALACLRQLGVRCIVYLDDLLIMGQSPEEARQVTANTLALFQALGFLINWEKSILEPKQEIVFLGLLVSSRTMTLSLPSPKLIDLRREIQSLLTKEVVSVRQLAHIVGKLNSTALAVLPAPLHYRELQNLKISSLHEMESYNAQTALSPAARDDLSWLATMIGRPWLLPRWLLSTAAVEWPFLHCQTTRSSHPVRRLPKRLGSGISGPMHSGTVVLRGVNVAHKLPGVESSHLGDSDIPEWPTQPAGAHPAGQHLSSGIHKPQRRNPLPTADEADQQPLGVVSGPSDSSAGHSPPRRLQHTGRPSILALDRQVRLEAQPNCLSEHPAHMGTPRDGLVCVTAVNPTTPFLQLEARSRSLGNRCVRSGLDPVSGFCESSLVPSGQVSSTGGTPGSGVSDGDSSMVQPAMVAPDPVSMCGTSTSDPQQTRHHGTNISSNATPVREPSSASRLEAFRESCKTNQLSESSTRLLLSSWRNSTGKSYDSAWRKWASWCDQRKIPPISCSANQVVDFLAEQFDRGMSYSSLNVYRSAISSIHLPCEGRPIGEHPLVSRVLRGAFTRRPPQPKHQAFWDVEVVLSSLRELGDNESLTLGDLSRKLAMLLALVSANRSSDLAKLSLSHCQVMPYKAVFFPTDLRKQDRPGHKRAAFIVPAFEGDALICPFQCLSVYIRRTSPLRTESEAGPLFISFVKPHKPVSSASLARWLKSVLSSAGIKGFTAHSTRGAGTSKAASSGLSTQEILRLADWSRESTFRRFYYKPVPEYSQDTLSAHSFSDAVLSSVPKS